MTDCPEQSLARRVKALELVQAAEIHPPAFITWGQTAFAWDVVTQTGNIPIYQVYAYEAVAPDDTLVASAEYIYLHHQPVGMVLTEGIRISSAHPGASGLTLQVFADAQPLFPAPLTIGFATQIFDASTMIPGREVIPAGAKLEIRILTVPAAYGGNWRGLVVDFLGYTFLDGVVTASPPFNVQPPLISALGIVGTTASSVPGTWYGAPHNFTYQWLTGEIGTMVPVDGATESLYEIAADDIGKLLQLVVTAHNAAGATPAYSNSKRLSATPSADL